MDVENIFFEVVGYYVVGDAENLFYHDWGVANGLWMQETDQGLKAGQKVLLFGC